VHFIGFIWLMCDNAGCGHRGLDTNYITSENVTNFVCSTETVLLMRPMAAVYNVLLGAMFLEN
jgi:hypothetical protein